MRKLELVFISTPIIGHLSSTVELANLLLNRDDRLFITLLLPDLLTGHIQPPSATQRIRFITLPLQPQHHQTLSRLEFDSFVQTQKPRIREAVAELTASERGPDSPTLAGFVVDMFFINIMDLADELKVPTYVFFTSSAGYLSFLFHFQELYDRNDKDLEKLLDSTTEFTLPGFINPIPRKNFPAIFSDKDPAEWIHETTRKLREARGILVNTFSELESDTMSWFSSSTATSQLPPVYAVGPVLSLKKNGTAASGFGGTASQGANILKWLDEQPPSSVVFLCFGSLGSFNEDQIKEIARALERSGVRFLWSLRQTAPKGKHGPPSDDAIMEDVLPEGFLDRTAGIGKVIGWAPQVEILAHPATGGFVSHCGWNSTLESFRYGVPMATWPMYAEQQFNAFEMVVELGLTVEISLEYIMKDFKKEEEEELILSAEKIESGIRKLMNGNDELKKLAKVKSEESKKTMMEGGSSFTALGRFIDAVIANCP